MNDFKTKKVLLTGGLGTLGRAQASAFVKAGANVVVLDRASEEEARDTLSSIENSVDYCRCDLNDLGVVEEDISKVISENSGFDILINNAALIINKPHTDFSIKEYEDQIRVNSSAAFLLSRLCADSMKEKRFGRIVNFTSVTLTGQWDGYVPYVASKGAMLGLTKSLARELGAFGITVNAVAPGAVVSEAEERVFGDRLEEYNEWVLERQCLKQRINPADVADLVLFLCSEKAKMISGQNIHVDGGW